MPYYNLVHHPSVPADVREFALDSWPVRVFLTPKGLPAPRSLYTLAQFIATKIGVNIDPQISLPVGGQMQVYSVWRGLTNGVCMCLWYVVGPSKAARARACGLVSAERTGRVWCAAKAPALPLSVAPTHSAPARTHSAAIQPDRKQVCDGMR